MRKQITAVLLIGVLAVIPFAGVAAAQSKPQTQPVAKSLTTKPVTTHATTGVVKSVDNNSLVIRRTGKRHGDMTFALNASTEKEGTVAVGAPVSVRYHQDGKTNVATAIKVQEGKQTAAAKKPVKK